MTEPTPSSPSPESQPRPHAAQPPAAPAVPTGPAAERRRLLSIALTFSFLCNCAALVVLAIVCVGVIGLRNSLDASNNTGIRLNETFYSGKTDAKDKIAIVSVNGVIMEGMLSFAHRQIEEAAEDDDVKAVVLHINSPGGSITASDDLHRRIVNLQEGTTPGRKSARKPIVVSMSSVAASGGYYIATPARTIVAERTTMTGSIGVYSAFPNVSGLMGRYDVKMNVIKQGQIKDSGSPFKPMTEGEERVWQDMVDHAYLQFLHVVEEGRKDRITVPSLLTEFDIAPTEEQKKLQHPPPGPAYKRYLADGGVYTADLAKQYGLIDQIGYLDDAVAEAQKAAGLGTEYKAIRYEKQQGLLERVLGIQVQSTNTSLLNPGQVKNGFVPRLWYLMPGSEVSGILAGMEKPDE
jgi:protease IV